MFDKSIHTLQIGADGVNSKVRNASNLDYTTFNYNQHGLVAIVEIQVYQIDQQLHNKLSQTSNGKNETAWQRFTKLGPVALLPLSDTVSGLTWSTSPEEAQRLKHLPADQFVDELNNALVRNKHSFHQETWSTFSSLKRISCLMLTRPSLH